MWVNIKKERVALDVPSCNYQSTISTRKIREYQRMAIFLVNNALQPVLITFSNNIVSITKIMSKPYSPVGNCRWALIRKGIRQTKSYRVWGRRGVLINEGARSFKK